MSLAAAKELLETREAWQKHHDDKIEQVEEEMRRALNDELNGLRSRLESLSEDNERLQEENRNAAKRALFLLLPTLIISVAYPSIEFHFGLFLYLSYFSPFLQRRSVSSSLFRT